MFFLFCFPLLQLDRWNSVLAVSYPARKYGIKRGDSWDDVSQKSNNTCWAIHLPIIPMIKAAGAAAADNDDDNDDDNNIEETPQDDENDNNNNNSSNNNYDIDEEFERVFRLSPEEQQKCQQTENGVRRFHQEGKASLERYRLASQVIFKKVLQSLRKRLSSGFVLEKASIDEFYLDISEYCYSSKATTDPTDETSTIDDVMEKTVIIGQQENQQQQSSSSFLSSFNDDEYDVIESALQRACQVAYWVRNDVLNDLGFTMSCGISTNKMMAKLAASFGKPNGQAVLHPQYFPKVMAETKITKVRNFGGKLGREVLKLLYSTTNGSTGNQDNMKEFANSATMADLATIPLPALQSSISSDTAQFIFQACQGIDNEAVSETSGALVKSITAFKSFTATKNSSEIYDWLNLLATEIAERVAQDTGRNHRYPKSCTLNYTYYTTANGKRPFTGGSTRSQRQSRSLRLSFPSERESIQQKCDSLVRQAMAKLSPILKDHPLRGIGLSASNFESRGQPPQGIASIQSFFTVASSSSPKQKSAVGQNETTAGTQQQQSTTTTG